MRAWSSRLLGQGPAPKRLVADATIKRVRELVRELVPSCRVNIDVSGQPSTSPRIPPGPTPERYRVSEDLWRFTLEVVLEKPPWAWTGWHQVIRCLQQACFEVVFPERLAPTQGAAAAAALRGDAPSGVSLESAFRDAAEGEVVEMQAVRGTRL